MAHVIYMLVIFLMVKLVILVEIKGRWEKKKSKRRKGKKEISCPEFTYIIFHGLLWGVELLVVGTATQGVYQPERQQMNTSRVA